MEGGLGVVPSYSRPFLAVPARLALGNPFLSVLPHKTGGSASATRLGGPRARHEALASNLGGHLGCPQGARIPSSGWRGPGLSGDVAGGILMQGSPLRPASPVTHRETTAQELFCVDKLTDGTVWEMCLNSENLLWSKNRDREGTVKLTGQATQAPPLTMAGLPRSSCAVIVESSPVASRLPQYFRPQQWECSLP